MELETTGYAFICILVDQRTTDFMYLMDRSFLVHGFQKSFKLEHEEIGEAMLKLFCQFNFTVKSDQMKWLPEGSEMPFDTKAKFTSYGSSQETLAGIPQEGIACQYPDIIVARLRPGQVWIIDLSCTIL